MSAIPGHTISPPNRLTGLPRNKRHGKGLIAAVPAPVLHISPTSTISYLNLYITNNKDTEWNESSNAYWQLDSMAQMGVSYRGVGHFIACRHLSVEPTRS